MADAPFQNGVTEHPNQTLYHIIQYLLHLAPFQNGVAEHPNQTLDQIMQ